MKRYSLIIVSMLILFVSCSVENKPKEINITIVETSDVHGAIFDYDFIRDREMWGGLSKVQSLLNDVRDTTNVVLLDNGDILQGQPTVYYYNYENTNETHLYSDVMNFMKYDAGTLGNHDIEAGHKVYDKMRNEIKFPWLAANAIDILTGEPYFEPYTIIKKEGVKIAVLGLITPGIPNWLPEELWEGIEFEDMVVTAKRWIPIIQKNEKPDFIIGLFHAGYDYTYGNVDYDTPKNENGSVIVAEQVPGFDVIFVGHDHRTWNEKVQDINGKDVYIFGPTSGAREVIAVNVNFSLNEKGEYNKKISGSVIEMKNYKADSLFNQEFNQEFNTVKEYVSRKVGDFQETIYAHDALYGPSAFTDLIHNVQFEICDVDVSFTAPLTFNSVIEKGPVYVRDMFKLYRFENFLYTMELSGKEIDGYLEYSFANWLNTMKSENDNLLQFKKDKDGNLEYSQRNQSYALNTNYYNFDAAAGIKYTVDVTKPAGEKVNIISMSDGNEFNEEAIYKVAINSYRGNGGGGHLVHGAKIPEEELSSRRISSTEKDLRFYLMKWIEEKGEVIPTERNDWKVIPEEYWIKGKERDKILLNN